jgi:Uncharacterized protein conserved in bacteria
MNNSENQRRRDDAVVAAAAAEPQATPRGSGGLPITVIVIAAALLVVAAGYTAYWMVAVAQLEARVAGWIEDRRAEGLRVDYGTLTRSGFPRRLRVTVAPLEIAAPVGWTWRAPELRVRADPFAPRAVRLSADGLQEVRLPLGKGSSVAFDIQADRLDADITSVGGRLSGRAIGERLSVRPAGGGETESLGIGSMQLEATPGTAASPSAEVTNDRFTLAVSDLVLPAASRPPLGDRIESASMLVEVTGTVPGDVTGMPWPKVIGRWRDEGGTVEIRDLAFHYGPLLVSGNGTLALDATGEVIGAFSLRANGLVETLDVLADKGMISRLAAAGAALVFRSQQGKAAGGDASVALPASLQDRKLYLGPLPIARLPSMPWVPLPEPGS